ncbi:MAG: RNA-binding S4 domain-containing protein [Clostridia bacterium]|nr:RNA-binding S4 domain-containing protein [Clostridia bacterium]MBR5987513.1 RNA-binding S4 domain-containing protein [Clostridia bacterium]
MRLDKFLKVSRLIKRRTVAADACSASRVLLNGKEAKPAKEVKVGDEIEIVYGISRLKVRVTAVADVTKKQDAADLYEVID